MIDLINFKNILNFPSHPLMPLFSGSWDVSEAAKWRGSAAELRYNPYLRNGWVVIDTGVKGNSGTPLIEFAT